jgi:hypothetical protein
MCRLKFLKGLFLSLFSSRNHLHPQIQIFGHPTYVNFNTRMQLSFALMWTTCCVNVKHPVMINADMHCYNRPPPRCSFLLYYPCCYCQTTPINSCLLLLDISSPLPFTILLLHFLVSTGKNPYSWRK